MFLLFSSSYLILANIKALWQSIHDEKNKVERIILMGSLWRLMERSVQGGNVAEIYLQLSGTWQKEESFLVKVENN